MGGNVQIGSYKAQPIMFNKDSVVEVWSDVRGFFDGLSEAFLDKHQWPLTVDHPFVGTSWWLDHHAATLAEVRQHVGDVDVQVFESNREWLQDLLQNGTCYGGWLVLGSSAHGNELSVLVGKGTNEWYTSNPPKQKFSVVYQYDFQFVPDPGSKKQRFLHSSNWFDLTNGFKGAYHKILLNAIGLDDFKFSITHGLRRRDNNEEIPFGNYRATLFGDDAILVDVYSFIGLVQAVVNYCNDYERGRIFEKFEAHVMSTLRHEPDCLKEKAIGYLRDAIEAR